MFSFNCKGKLLFTDKPLIMGILNITDDSFYAGSRVKQLTDIKERAGMMIQDGAHIIDLGAQSTRPGSTRFSAKEELEKLIPALALLNENFPDTVFSIDTYHAEVAAACVAKGASIINDISGGNLDKNMIPTVAEMGVPYICMHMKGTPETMQQHTGYEDVTKEVLDYFIKKTEECTRAGIKDLVIDPGFGFGKNHSQNFKLLKDLSVFRILDKPIMAGLSRKSTIYKTLGIPVEEALNGTTVLQTIALMNGASLLRVHDVKEAKQSAVLYKAYVDA